MLATIDLRSQPLGARQLRAVLPRAEYDVEAALDAVRPISDDVHDRGAAALYDLAERFDGVRPSSLRVPQEVLEAAVDTLDPAVRTALEVAIERTRAVHADQRRTDTTTDLGGGGTVTERWVPVERVGLYVPGGRAVYPSSVVMNVVPAQIAGVGSLAVASPPQKENVGAFAGYPHPTILATCALLGVDEVWSMGGAQAVAGFDAAGKKAGQDYVYFPVPGTDGVFDFLADSFTLPVGAPHPGGTKAWLETISSTDGQLAFNLAKGSIPVNVIAAQLVKRGSVAP